MRILHLQSGDSVQVEILRIEANDYQLISKSQFWFDWKIEKEYDVYKLCIKSTNNILGVISLETFPSESRIEIRLLAVSKENRGNNKKYDHIAGNLIAFAGIQAVKLFGEMACISLVPKTELIEHYMKKYYMLQAGRSLFLDGRELLQLIIKYDHE